MNSATLFSSAFLFLGASCALAQNAKPPPPSKPYVAQVPDPAKWVVTYNHLADRDKQTAANLPQDALQNLMRTELDERSGKTVHTVFTDASGRSTERWQYDRF